MGGFKRSLLAAGLMASGATSYLFPVPPPSSLSTTSTGQAIAARQAKHSLAAATHGASPPPRMGTAAMPRSEQATRRTAPGASSLSSSSLSSSSSGVAEPIAVFPSVTRSPRPGIVARDGTRDDGRRERDDGKSPDFEVNLGRVISTLREDYPRILTDPPSFDIFTDEIELRDPVRRSLCNWELECFASDFAVILISGSFSISTFNVRGACGERTDYNYNRQAGFSSIYVASSVWCLGACCCVAQ